MSSRIQLLALALVGLLSRAEVSRAEDAPPPSLALATDRATAAPRLVLSASVRAPFDRSYGLVLAFAPVRHLAVEGELAMDERARLSLRGGALLRPFGRRHEGLLLRGAIGVRFEGDGASGPSSAWNGALAAGASTILRGTYVEASAGVRTSRAIGRDAPLRYGVLLECRLGFVF